MCSGNCKDECTCNSTGLRVADQELLGKMKAAMERHAAELKRMEEEHMAEHVKFKIERSELLNELRLKKAKLSEKRKHGKDSLKGTVSQALLDIDSFASSNPIEDKIIREFLINELELAMEELESVNKIVTNSLELYATWPEHHPKWPCPDCSEEPSELVNKEREAHQNLARAREILKQKKQEKSIGLSDNDLILQMMKEALTVNFECIEKRVSELEIVKQD